ncbi:MAG: hypothetical protein AAF460_04790 [Pseudomonadota bacterium]
MTDVVGIVIIFCGVFIWMLPAVLIADSPRTYGGEKVAWVAGVVVGSWITWIAFSIFAPVRRYPY